jgi:hypothetical protein
LDAPFQNVDGADGAAKGAGERGPKLIGAEISNSRSQSDRRRRLDTRDRVEPFARII